MRIRWKILGGTTAAGFVAAALIVGKSGLVKGDDSAQSSSADASSASMGPAVLPHDQPYPLGPDAIEFDKLSASDQAAVELIQETVEVTQPASSYQAWAAATAATGRAAEATIAARAVGLLGADQDGVVE